MISGPTIQFKRLRPEKDADLSLPAYMTAHAAGMDICAAIQAPQTIDPGEIVLIPSGFALAIPRGFEVQIRPRSGLAVKHGISIVNAPGTIDADYRGEVKIGLINLSSKMYTIQRGDRIAQMVVQRAYQAEIAEVENLDTTERNQGGFGHTGK
jgi:dUTP pyrophosphatase